MKNKVMKFNKSLLQNGDITSSDDSDSESECVEDDEHTSDSSRSEASNAEEYYQSQSWYRLIDDVCATYTDIQVPQYSTTSSPPSRPVPVPDIQVPQYSTLTTSPPSRPVLVPHHPSHSNTLQANHQVQAVANPANVRNFKLWYFPVTLSQSTLNGRNTGSNACSIISLLTSHYIKENAENLDLDYSTDTLSEHWTVLMKTAISVGNELHDNFFDGSARNLTVDEAVMITEHSLPDGFQVPNTYDVGLLPSPNDPETDSLPYYIRHLATSPENAIILTYNSLTISLSPCSGNNILVCDSHLHTAKVQGKLVCKGAFIGLLSLDSIIHFINFIKHPARNLCSLAVVKYS